uniref:Uncharacterized protein n=1 Tax=Romanomermis culicivorax TaxID=13658 RepID=A0A915L6Y5_ROMCU
MHEILVAGRIFGAVDAIIFRIEINSRLMVNSRFHRASDADSSAARLVVVRIPEKGRFGFHLSDKWKAFGSRIFKKDEEINDKLRDAGNNRKSCYEIVRNPLTVGYFKTFSYPVRSKWSLHCENCHVLLPWSVPNSAKNKIKHNLISTLQIYEHSKKTNGLDRILIEIM